MACWDNDLVLSWVTLNGDIKSLSKSLLWWESGFWIIITWPFLFLICLVMKYLTKNTCRLYEILVTKGLISPTFLQDFGVESFPPILNLLLFPGHRKDKLSGRVKMAKSWFKPETQKNFAWINRKLSNICDWVLSRGLVTKIKWPSH